MKEFKQDYSIDLKRKYLNYVNYHHSNMKSTS